MDLDAFEEGELLASRRKNLSMCSCASLVPLGMKWEMEEGLWSAGGLVWRGMPAVCSVALCSVALRCVVSVVLLLVCSCVLDCHRCVADCVSVVW